SQTPKPGQTEFEGRCSKCHGGDGNGGELGPSIIRRVAQRNDDELAAVVRAAVPNRGMPPFEIADVEMKGLISFTRTLRMPNRGAVGPVKMTIETTDGRTLEGLALSQGYDDLQLQTKDDRLELFRKQGARYRPVTSQTDWSSYNGDASGNRYTALKQIDASNVSRLAARWMYSIADA